MNLSIMTSKMMSDINAIRETTFDINGTYQNTVHEMHEIPEKTPDYVFSLYGGYVLLIFVTGLIQNGVTLSVFLREKRLWKVHNYFIVGLAFSDMGMCIFGNWMIIASAFNHRWVFQRHGCVYYGFATTLLGITQISLLAAIAFDRYVIIVKPRGFVMHGKNAIKLVLGCYFYGFLWALFPVLGWSSYQLEGINIRCAIYWQSQTPVDLSFSMTILVLGWLLPLSVILFSYGCIFSTLHRHKKKPLRRQMDLMRKTTKRQRLERKMAITVLLMIGAFFVSWTPYSVVTLAVAFCKMNVPPSVSAIPALLAKTSIIWNPVIYVARHSEFRRACFSRFPMLRRSKDISLPQGSGCSSDTRNRELLPSS